MAWLKDGLVKTDTAVKTGVVSNRFTGDWVVMTVPASEGLFSAAKLARLKNTASYFSSHSAENFLCNGENYGK